MNYEAAININCLLNEWMVGWGLDVVIRFGFLSVLKKIFKL